MSPGICSLNDNGKIIFRSTQLHFKRTWIYSFNDPEHRWVNGVRATGTAFSQTQRWSKKVAQFRKAFCPAELTCARSTRVVCKSNSENNGKCFSIEKTNFKRHTFETMLFTFLVSLEQSTGSQIRQVFKTFCINIYSSIRNCSLHLKLSLQQVNWLSPYC